MCVVFSMFRSTGANGKEGGRGGREKKKRTSTWNEIVEPTDEPTTRKSNKTQENKANLTRS